ncbi:MAG: sugar transferase [Bdellovibrionales bacterium]|nr:sugar transferase [Bdellovibrionales bacterium]
MDAAELRGGYVAIGGQMRVRGPAAWSQTLFLLGLVWAWFLVAASHGHLSEGLAPPLLWAMLVGWSTQRALVMLGYFDAFRPLPKRSDIITLLLTLPWFALLGKYLIFLVSENEVLRYREILWGTPVVALVSFLFQNVASRLALRLKGKRRVLMVLSPAERDYLFATVKDWKLERFFEFVDDRQLAQSVDLVLMSRSSLRDFRGNEELLSAHIGGVPILDFRRLIDELEGRLDLAKSDAWFFLVMASLKTRWVRFYFNLKVWAEPLLAILLLLITLPIGFLVAVAVKLSGAGPVIYRQRRTGYRGEVFELLKFRTMQEDAEKSGPRWASEGDARVTRIGRYLRTSRLDEWPQLWNVVRGQVGFIGPRPERPEFYAQFATEIPLFYLRTLVRPGISGWAQVMAGYAASVEDSRKKLEYDLYYIQNMSLRLDLVVIIKTFMLILEGGGGR